MGVAADCLGSVQLMETMGGCLTYMPFNNHSKSSFNPSGMSSRLNRRADMLAEMGTLNFSCLRMSVQS
jgi:hypothetical protein